MRHHQTRRKGRSLKKRARTTRRRQRGGAAITSIEEWFKVVKAFEDANQPTGDRYSVMALQDSSLVLPPFDQNDTQQFNINGYDHQYIDYDIRQLPEILSVLQPILSQTPTAKEFQVYVSKYKTIAESDIGTPVETTANSIQIFNEIETQLNKKAVELGMADREFTDIYTISKHPLYIWYLALNPNQINEDQVQPMLDKLPEGISIPQAPAEPGA